MNWREEQHAIFLRLHEESLPQEEADEKAKALFEAGYVQTSVKYRRLKRVPDLVESIMRIADEKPGELQRIQEKTEAYKQSLIEEFYAKELLALEGDLVEVDLRTFKAFQKRRNENGQPK